VILCHFQGDDPAAAASLSLRQFFSKRRLQAVPAIRPQEIHRCLPLAAFPAGGTSRHCGRLGGGLVWRDTFIAETHGLSWIIMDFDHPNLMVLGFRGHVAMILRYSGLHELGSQWNAWHHGGKTYDSIQKRWALHVLLLEGIKSKYVRTNEYGTS